jgi:hypothetical protein
MKSHLQYLWLFLVFFSTQVFSAENCTGKPLGLKKSITSEGITLEAVTNATASSSSIDSLNIAKKEARLKARLLLLKSKIFQHKENEISGIFDVSSCVEVDNIFVVVKISDKSIKQAREMKTEFEQ